MTNKSAIQKLFSLKATVTIILIALVIGGVYTTIHKKNAKIESENTEEKAELVVKATGLNSAESVKNIGDVEKVIAKWVEANPEAIIQSVVTMQQKAAEKQQHDAQKNISSKQSDLFKTKTDPVFAPKGYNVSLVEFFDYNCGYCKKAQITVEDLIKQDKKVRIIFKELPILGASSVELSKVAIAVNMVSADSYLSFHNALMKGSARTREDALAIAKNLNIDVQKVEKTLESKKSEIEAQIKVNQELAASIGINGTPAFVIGENLVPGALDVASLKEKIAAERKK
ncbi:MAG: DsbA family protein [Pseudomonadota bacterium]